MVMVQCYKFVEENNLVEKCKGEVTWEGRGSKSTIDFIIVDKDIYENFIYMNIDETKEEYDMSDHNLVTAVFEIEASIKHQTSSTKIKIFERFIESSICKDCCLVFSCQKYYKINEETI